MRMVGVALLVAALGAGAAHADQGTEVAEFDRLRVIGSPARVQSVPGSAHYIGSEDLGRFDYFDVNRVLRLVPGIYLVEEEGFGLRPSIGMRGSGTDRSSRITLLEDGVLVAPAPYSAPAAYHFPTMARMHAVEVRKGSVSIKHGPYTTGGAVNMISTPIPTAGDGALRAYGGPFGARHLHGWVGDGGDRFGWLLETVQQRSDGFKQLDGGGDTGFTLADHVAKFAWRPATELDQVFELKLGAVAHSADETYVGLTADDFTATPLRRYAASRVDHLDTRHRQYQLRHRMNAGAFDFTTVAYRNGFSRAWYKLQTVGGRSLSTLLADPGSFPDEMAWTRGADSPLDALTVRNNARDYQATGIQHVVGWSGQTGAVAHDVEVGLRLHRDEEDRVQQEDGYTMRGGRMLLTARGAPGSQDNRLGEAAVVALYLHDEIAFGDWVFTPGVRHERITSTRTDYALGDPNRLMGPTQVRENTHDVWIPGVGASYRLSPGATAFASVHKGFTPSAPGSTAATPEESVNFEIGARWSHGVFGAEVVGFFNDYSNLVGTCTASTGGGCNVGDQFDGGEVAMRGLEVLTRYAHVTPDRRFRFPVTFTYTFTDAEFSSSFTSGFSEFGAVTRGDELPYLPRQQWRLGTGMEAAAWSVNLGATWVDTMRTVAGTGTPPREQRTDSYLVVDLAAGWAVREGVELFGRVENLLDETYIVAWRPAGARPGKPRSVFAGVRLGF